MKHYVDLVLWVLSKMANMKIPEAEDFTDNIVIEDMLNIRQFFKENSFLLFFFQMQYS